MRLKETKTDKYGTILALRGQGKWFHCQSGFETPDKILFLDRERKLENIVPKKSIADDKVEDGRFSTKLNGYYP
jgi:hypothetical protein